MKKTIILLIAMLIFALVSGIGTAREIFVQPGSSIQAAVNSASSGDIIIVKPGTYSENILINKANLVVRSESGNPEDTVITANYSGVNVFYARSNNITISGFKVVNPGGYSNVTGILLSNCSNCFITNNNLSGNTLGIYLSGSKYNTVSGNSANSNSRYGFHLVRSEGNTLSNNNANSNGHGFVLENNSNGNALTGNIASSSAGLIRSSGFYSTHSNSNILNKNIATNNPWGIYFTNSNTSTISGNDVSNNNEYGMWISLSNYNTISGNIANETRRGIFLDSSSRNTLSENVVAFNDVSGLYECPGCHYNTIYNNYLNNARNADIRNRDTTWYRSKTAGINIVGGPYIGGNYWASPAGTGFSEIAQDRDGDGISDTEYNVSNITDKLPLVAGKSNLPVANFGMTPANGSGYAPLAVQFTDLSVNAAGISWDFENDGTIDSTEKNPVYTYTVPGTYTVSLTAINTNGTASKFAIITVLKPAGVLPVANFSANVISGYAPLAVQFTDLSQNAFLWIWDFNNDGISDSSDQNPVNLYTTPGNYTVNLTVSNENGTSSATQKIIVLDPKDLPIADFSTNVTSGYAPLAVQFTDLSRNSTGIAWDFNNDWQGDSGETAPAYVFENTGSYNINLIAFNGNGTTTKTTTIVVLEKSPDGGSGGGSSKGGSSGGSGGAGGSPEPAKNIKVKELSQTFITSGKPVKFEFPKNVTSIVYLNFDSKKTVGKTTTIVEMLKNKSMLTPDAPEGEVYNYLNIWVGNAGYGEKSVENAVVCFKVEKSWIEDKDIDQSSVTLNRYNDKKWNKLPTNLSGEDDKYMYFTAETAGFSPFAITGEITEKKTATEVQPETEDTEESDGSTAGNIEQQPENEGNDSTPEEKKSSAPGFETIFGVVGLLAVFLYKRK